MSMKTLQILRAIGYLGFVVGTFWFVNHTPASMFGLIVPAVPLFIATGIGMVIHKRLGTYQKRYEWFQKNVTGSIQAKKNE